jgi:hypothetical protein
MLHLICTFPSAFKTPHSEKLNAAARVARFPCTNVRKLTSLTNFSLRVVTRWERKGLWAGLAGVIRKKNIAKEKKTAYYRRQLVLDFCRDFSVPATIYTPTQM